MVAVADFRGADADQSAINAELQAPLSPETLLSAEAEARLMTRASQLVERLHHRTFSLHTTSTMGHSP
jgi:hypothetical protein